MAAYAAHTLADMQTALLEKVEGVPFWTTTEATDALNEALLMWNLMTGFWKDTYNTVTTATNWDYALPASLVFGTRVLCNGKVLAEASLYEINSARPNWQGEMTTSGGSVPTAPQKWFPLSIDLIGIWPADAAGGLSLVVEGVAQTPRLVNPSDFIDIGDEEFNAILGYALHVLALKEGGARFIATMPLLVTFLQEAAEENSQLTQSAMFRHLSGTDMTRQARPTLGTATDYDRFGGRSPKGDTNQMIAQKLAKLLSSGG